MTLRWQLMNLLNSYNKTTVFSVDLPKWDILIEMGEMCLSDSILDEDLEKRNRLKEVLARLKKNIVNPKSEDVAFIIRVTDDILTRKHEEIPEGTMAIGEDVI